MSHLLSVLACVEKCVCFWPSTDGIEYNNSCPCSVSSDFFELFSILFARAARGTIFFLGYGEKAGGTFSENSFFAKYEIPNLSTSEVTRAVVMVVHRKDRGEHLCGVCVCVYVWCDVCVCIVLHIILGKSSGIMYILSFLDHPIKFAHNCDTILRYTVTLYYAGVKMLTLF